MIQSETVTVNKEELVEKMNELILGICSYLYEECSWRCCEYELKECRDEIAKAAKGITELCGLKGYCFARLGAGYYRCGSFSFVLKEAEFNGKKLDIFRGDEINDNI